MKEKVKSFYDPHFNNRMPVYVEKPMPERKLCHVEIVDGKRVWVDGKKFNKYSGIDGESLKLQARIDAGTFENHEGVERKLEKAVGSDIVNRQIENSRRDYEKKIEEQHEKERREEYKKIVDSMKRKVSEE